MKRIVAALLVLTMIFGLSATAMAASKSFVKGDWVVLRRNATAYNAPKSSKATASVAEKGSVAKVVNQYGDFVKVKVTAQKTSKITTYFRKSDLKRYNGESDPSILVYWIRGGRGMSTSLDWIIDYYPEMTKVKVTGHTNLRKTNGFELRSLGAVEKGDVLKYLGKMGYDDRGVGWLKVRKNGKTMWLSVHFASMPYSKKK